MNLWLVLAFLFFIGSLSGWCLELLYRKFFSDANPDRKWINPGFLSGPYLPLYGFSLCVLFLLAHIKIVYIDNVIVSKIVLFGIMAIVVTLIEYLAGLIFIKKMKVKLWDYENEWGNIKGIICPKYTFYWMILSAIYYFIIHPKILKSLFWLSEHLTFSFIMGMFYGVFAMDCYYTMNILARIREFANEYQIIVRYEHLKEHIRLVNEGLKEKRKFIFAFKSDNTNFADNIRNYIEQNIRNLEDNAKKWRKK